MKVDQQRGQAVAFEAIFSTPGVSASRSSQPASGLRDPSRGAARKLGMSSNPTYVHMPQPRRRLSLLVALMGALLMSGCARFDINTYATAKPAFDPFLYFAGDVHAWGLVQDWRGRVTRRFDVTIKGHQDGEFMVLDEKFRYDDGETATRTWRIARTGNGAFSGTADDIVGKAIGQTAGNAMHWTYDLDLVVNASTYRIAFDDWMWQLDGEALINRSKLRKFGVTVGEVIIFMKRESSAP